MRWVSALFLGVTFAVGSLACDARAQAVPAGPAARPERAALALKLVQVTNGETLTRIQIDKMLNETLPKTLATDPEFASLERQHPGIGEAFIAAMKPVVLDYTMRSLPGLWQRLAPVYAEAFEASELATLLAFYRSATGQRLIGIIGQEADFFAVLSQSIEDQDAKISAGTIAQGQNVGIAALQRRLTDAELAEVAELETSPIGRRLLALNVRTREITAEWANAPDPAIEAEIEKALLPVLQRFTETKGAPK